MTRTKQFERPSGLYRRHPVSGDYPLELCLHGQRIAWWDVEGIYHVVDQAAVRQFVRETLGLESRRDEA